MSTEETINSPKEQTRAREATQELYATKEDAVVTVSRLAKLIDEREIVFLNDGCQRRVGTKSQRITWSNLLSLTE